MLKVLVCSETSYFGNNLREVAVCVEINIIIAQLAVCMTLQYI